MEKITIPKDDKGYRLNLTINDSDGDADDISWATALMLKSWVVGIPDTLLVNATCTAVVATQGTLYYTVLAGDFDTVGRYHAEIEMIATGIKESTEVFSITVSESG